MNPPIKPGPSDCCNSGCNPCILDVYEEQLKKYQKALKTSSKDDNVRNCMSPTSYSVFTIVEATPHTKDSFLYTFEYLKPENSPENKELPRIIYNPGQHFILKAKTAKETFSRAYTPIYIENQNPLFFTILVKLYQYGKMSNFFKSLSLGVETLWRGPYGNFITNYGEKNMLCVAQGTGIAPIYTILCNLLQNEDCYTKITLLYCVSSQNLFLRDQIYNLACYWNFKYDLFLNGSREAFIRKYNETVHFCKLELDQFRSYFVGTNNNTQILICGSENFSTKIKNFALCCNESEENIFVF